MATKALVLGGGGVTGVAWELGILHGLAEADTDLTDADLVVGTSAGSVVAAQVTAGTGLAELYERQLRGAGSEVAARMRIGTMLRLAAASLGTRNTQEAGVRIGRLALAARTVPAAERRAIIASRLPVDTWPDRRLLITAVAADTGEFVTFDRDSGVPLVDAVAASCAVPGVWPPAVIDGRPYLDGGMRSPANVDLAEGAERVVVLAPIGTSFRRSMGVAAQVAALGAGTKATVVMPDAAARAAIGRNVLDPARRAAAARAGLAQAASIVDRIRAVWRD
jgi:NTE family protein